jgi:hypothetical protein
VLKRFRDRGTKDSATRAAGAGLVVRDGDRDQLASAQIGYDHRTANPDSRLSTEVRVPLPEEIDDLQTEASWTVRSEVLSRHDPHDLVLLETGRFIGISSVCSV